jgi:DNA-binding TFAR19-related protein (PDSD5 family)/DNA-binding XRE family transcriptional regulator
MSAEIREWLADLTVSHPDAALAVGQALVALADMGQDLGPPVVVALESPPESADPAEALDYSYHRRLDRLQIVRHALADVTDLSSQIRRHITELEASQSMADAAELRCLLPGLDRSEQRLTAASQQMQADIDAFRVRKETLKAKLTVAEVTKAIAGYIADVAAGSGDEKPARDSPAIPEAGESTEDLTAEIERELGREANLRGLMELRPGAPGRPAGSIRVIFAVEPPDTALLISVIEGGAAIRYQHAEATALSAEVLEQVRAGLDPEATAVVFADTQSFIAEFFPGSASEVRARADALLASAQARRTAAADLLAGKREGLRMTMAEVAARMGVSQERISAIERDADAAQVRALAGYVEALGGRLEVIADFDGEQIALR